MTSLFIIVAIAAGLFALPGGRRNESDRRLAQTIAFVALAAVLFFLKLGVLGLIVLAVGGGLFGIGWLKDRLTNEGFQDLSDDGDGSAPPSRTQTTAMDREEALAVLALSGTPHRAAIIEAHRRMIAKAHPDMGGSDYLAAKINQARDVLLND